MKITVNKKMGDAEFKFDFEGTDFKEAFHKAAFLAEKDWCNLEGFADANVKYDARKVKTENGEFLYIKRKAWAKDGRVAESTLGTYQGGGYFWKEWEIWEGKKEDTVE